MVKQTTFLPMILIDYILLAPIIFGVVYGFYRGFFKELVLVVCVMVALFVSRYFGELVAIVLSKLIGCSLNVAKSVSFILIFVATIIGLNILANIFTELTKVLTLSWLNRLLGALLGGFKWLIVVSVVVNLLSFFYEKTGAENENRLSRLYFYKPVSCRFPIRNARSRRECPPYAGSRARPGSGQANSQARTADGHTKHVCQYRPRMARPPIARLDTGTRRESVAQF